MFYCFTFSFYTPLIFWCLGFALCITHLKNLNCCVEMLYIRNLTCLKTSLFFMWTVHKIRYILLRSHIVVACNISVFYLLIVWFYSHIMKLNIRNIPWKNVNVIFFYFARNSILVLKRLQLAKFEFFFFLIVNVLIIVNPTYLNELKKTVNYKIEEASLLISNQFTHKKHTKLIFLVF